MPRTGFIRTNSEYKFSEEFFDIYIYIYINNIIRSKKYILHALHQYFTEVTEKEGTFQDTAAQTLPITF